MVQRARSLLSEQAARQENQSREQSFGEGAELRTLGKLAAPITADVLYNCGAALWNRGRATEAIEMLDAALRARPDYP